MRVLLLPGGPAFHAPHELARQIAGLLEQEGARLGLPVVCDVNDLSVLTRLRDREDDLVVPLWTGGRLRPEEERGLVEAVHRGKGFATVHGGAAAFRDSFDYQSLVGGQFVAHPGGENVTYRVLVQRSHHLSAGLADVEVTTELYHLHVDPRVDVLASTSVGGEPHGVQTGMPVAWTLRQGSGRSAYCALGHRPDLLRGLVGDLVVRQMLWAAGVPDLEDHTRSGAE